MQALFDSQKIKRTVHVVSGRCWVAAIIGESLAKLESLTTKNMNCCCMVRTWNVDRDDDETLPAHTSDVLLSTIHYFPHSDYLIKCFPNHRYLMLFLPFLTLFLLLLVNIPDLSWNVSLIRDTFKFCLPPCHLRASAFTRMWPTLGGSCQSRVFHMSPLWFVFSYSIKSGLVHKKEGQFLIERCSFF